MSEEIEIVNEMLGYIKEVEPKQFFAVFLKGEEEIYATLPNHVVSESERHKIKPGALIEWQAVKHREKTSAKILFRELKRLSQQDKAIIALRAQSLLN